MNHADSIQQWLATLPPSQPLRAISDPPERDALRRLLREEKVPIKSHTAALLWLRIGEIDEPHTVVQDGTTSMAFWIHGIVHRMEGDFWNSNYWLRQVRDQKLLKQCSEWLVSALDKESLVELARRDELVVDQIYQPAALTNACERALARGDQAGEGLDDLRRFALLEWQALWNVHLEYE